MNAQDIKTIEAKVGMALPEFYCATMLNYPFPVDSFAAEFLLPNDLARLLSDNEDPGNYPGIDKAFMIGGDGGEERYFIDLASTSSQVFAFDLETGIHTAKATDWQQYLDQIAASLREIEEDERLRAERKANKKWWEFWK